MLDHVPSMLNQLQGRAKTGAEASLRELAKRPTVYVKVSQVMRIVDGKPSTDPAVYSPVLDYLFEIFGEDKLIFGSDWPNGPAVNNLQVIVQIVRDYFMAKGRAVAEKYF